jgi:predicted short-subunit dehydrogenase-like oxidoreductase (DUF2520 family)
VVALREPIAIAGAGAVAQALGRALHDRGERVVAIASRSRLTAERAALFIGASIRCVTFEELPDLSNRIIVAVSDRALRDVAHRMAGVTRHGAIALHSCGSQGPDALNELRRCGWACGVLHPLQTIPTPELGAPALVGIPFAVGGDAAAVTWASAIVASLEGVLLQVDEDRFPLYHAGAVLAGNGVFAVVDAAIALLVNAGIERGRAEEALGPLCRRSLENALTIGSGALTGPIARGDAVTLKAHVMALASAPRDAASIYQAVARAAIQLKRREGATPAILEQLEDALASAPTGDTHGSNPSTHH